VAAIHDVSAGGLAVALAEMAMAGRVGLDVDGVADASTLFSESSSRVVVCARADSEAALRAAADRRGVAVTPLGRVSGDRLIVRGLLDVAVDDLTHRWRDALPAALTASA